MKTYLTISLALYYITTLVAGTQDYCNQGFKPKQDGDYQLDLSPMNRDFMMEIKEDTKPTEKITRTYVNICNPLTRPEGVDEGDFCKPNTYACWRLFHKKGDKEDLNEFEELAGDYDNSKLAPEFKISPENQNEDLSKDGSKFTLTLHGASINSKAQTVEITLECGNQESRSNPNGPNLILSDDHYTTKLHWKVAFACATKAGEAPPPQPPSDGGNDQQPDQGGKSVISWFFTILGIALGVYFIGGAIYNFKVFNARGLDLIPHRDFWFDLPYLIKDLISHLMETVTSRRHGGSGYVSV